MDVPQQVFDDLDVVAPVAVAPRRCRVGVGAVVLLPSLALGVGQRPDHAPQDIRLRKVVLHDWVTVRESQQQPMWQKKYCMNSILEYWNDIQLYSISCFYETQRTLSFLRIYS